MRKKYLSALLFGALLVTSAGTFTSCKDYDDDIKNLQEQVDKIVTDLKTLQDAAGKYVTSVKYDAETGKLTVTGGNGESFQLPMPAELPTYSLEVKDGKVILKENGNAISEAELPTGPEAFNPELLEWKDGYLYYGDTKIEGVKEPVFDASITEIKENNKVVGYIIAIGEDKAIFYVKTDLKALVFQPDLYFEGVEGTKYHYALGEYLTDASTSKNGKDDAEVDYSIDDKAEWKWTPSIKPEDNFTLTPIDTVYYHLNPTSADISDIDWSFLYREPEYISRANDAASPVFKGATKKSDGSVAVGYSYNNPEELKYPTNEAGNMSVMALKAELANDTVVTSDYAAVVPVTQNLIAIAYTDKETLMPELGGEPFCKNDVYTQGDYAVENAASFDIQYNGGTLNLAEHLYIHYAEANFKESEINKTKHLKLSYKDATERYGLTFNYEMMPYTVGGHTTKESQYGKVDANTGVFTPCYVDDNGNSIECGVGEDNKTGISAVGRKPVVRVTVKNGENVVLVGYIKIHIVEAIGKYDWIVKDFETIPYMCGFKKEISWSEMSNSVYEHLKITKEQFLATYKVDAGKTYEKKANGEFVAVANNIYGQLRYQQDDKPSVTNDKIFWETFVTAPTYADNVKQVDAIYNADKNTHSKRLYLRFESNQNPNYSVYMGFTIKVADKPEVQYAEKIAKYWYPTSEANVALRDTVRMNVPRPTNDSSEPVTKYVKDLDDNFLGNEVVVSATNAEQNKFYDWDNLGIEYFYHFDSNQPKLTKDGVDYQLTVNIDKDELLYNGETVATIDPATGVVTYAATTEAKTILNLFGHDEQKPNQQFAKVVISSTYACDLALAQTSTFNVRFLRPIDIIDNENGKFIDAQAAGSTVKLVDLFGLEDWRNQPLIKKSGDTYIANVENGVDLYKYYEIKDVKVDIPNAKCDLNGKVQKVTEVTDALELAIVDENNNELTSGTITVDISDFEDLLKYGVNYKNNEGNVQEFTLWLPLEITYSWGTVKYEIECPVKSTMAN